MAYNVFGTPITNATLQGMPEYVGQTISRADRARVALNMKNASEKDVNALRYVENLRDRSGASIATLCLIYNATGDTVRLTTIRNWQGYAGPAPVPVYIQNGQWGAFLHVGTGHDSSGALVYNGLNNAGTSCDWMVAWFNPYSGRKNGWQNHVCTDITSQGSSRDWNATYHNQLIDNGRFQLFEWNNCVSTVSTGDAAHAIFEAILKLKV